MLLKPSQTKAPGALTQIRFVADAVSYRVPLPVTKVMELGYQNYFPVCPRCGVSMEREYTAYCDRCGQRLSWHVLRWTDVNKSDYGESLGISK